MKNSIAISIYHGWLNYRKEIPITIISIYGIVVFLSKKFQIDLPSYYSLIPYSWLVKFELILPKIIIYIILPGAACAVLFVYCVVMFVLIPFPSYVRAKYYDITKVFGAKYSIIQWIINLSIVGYISGFFLDVYWLKTTSLVCISTYIIFFILPKNYKPIISCLLIIIAVGAAYVLLSSDISNLGQYLVFIKTILFFIVIMDSSIALITEYEQEKERELEIYEARNGKIDIEERKQIIANIRDKGQFDRVKLGREHAKIKRKEELERQEKQKKEREKGEQQDDRPYDQMLARMGQENREAENRNAERSK